MAGLDPAIHVFGWAGKKDVDARDKPGHDESMEREPLRDVAEAPAPAPKTLTFRPLPPIRPPAPCKQDTNFGPPEAPTGCRGYQPRILKMSRRCELTAKGPQVGHKVSHSNIKTKRRFLPNLCNVTFISDALGKNVRLRVSTNAIKSVDHNGGLDAFLMKAKEDELSTRAREIKRAVQKKLKAAS